MCLILDTELIRYKWTGLNGNFPDYEKLIPAEFNTAAHFDAVEALKAVASLRFLSANPKAYPIDLTIGDGKIIMANPDDKGYAEVNADADGIAVKVRIDGSYLADALRACGGMVDFKLTNAYSPMLFTADGYQIVVMPMVTTEAAEALKRDKEAKAQAEPTTTEAGKPEDTEVAQAVAEAEAIAQAVAKPEPTEDKPKRKRKVKEPVAVA